jgi:hypothetical protein
MAGREELEREDLTLGKTIRGGWIAAPFGLEVYAAAGANAFTGQPIVIVRSACQIS